MAILLQELARHHSPDKRLDFLDAFFLEPKIFSSDNPPDAKKQLEAILREPHLRTRLTLYPLRLAEPSGKVVIKPSDSYRECISLAKSFTVKDKPYYLMRYESALGGNMTSYFHYLIIDPQYSEDNVSAFPLKYIVDINDTGNSTGLCLLTCRLGVEDITRPHANSLINAIERHISKDLRNNRCSSYIFRTDGSPLPLEWCVQTAGKVSK